MENFIEILRKTKLFSGVSKEEIRSMLNCLDARLYDYKKGDYWDKVYFDYEDYEITYTYTDLLTSEDNMSTYFDQHYESACADTLLWIQNGCC